MRVETTEVHWTERIIVVAFITGGLFGCEPKPPVVPVTPEPAPVASTSSDTQVEPVAATPDETPVDPEAVRARREAARREAEADVDGATTANELEIDRVGPHHFKLTRASVDAMLQEPARLMGSARAVPERRDDNWVGVKLSSVAEGSIYHRLGFRDEDVIVEVGGYPVHQPDKALEAYAKLRAADRIDVKIQRGGETIVLRYDIEAPKP